MYKLKKDYSLKRELLKNVEVGDFFTLRDDTVYMKILMSSKTFSVRSSDIPDGCLAVNMKTHKVVLEHSNTAVTNLRVTKNMKVSPV